MGRMIFEAFFQTIASNRLTWGTESVALSGYGNAARALTRRSRANKPLVTNLGMTAYSLSKLGEATRRILGPCSGAAPQPHLCTAPSRVFHSDQAMPAAIRPMVTARLATGGNFASPSRKSETKIFEPMKISTAASACFR